ncbi:MAG: DUF362 domain-containing protein [Bacteroidia bacterium]|nr:DUF362 domain-containing protein [Bacteroidia bacterium]
MINEKVRPISSALVANTKIPKFFKVRQNFFTNGIKVEEIPSVVSKKIGRPEIKRRITPNANIAITVGSRGISNIQVLVKSIVDYVKECGANPFIVPSMGSHGKATSEGQLQILKSYGITEEYLECPIRSSMEVVKIGTLDDGRDVFIDKEAYNSDGIIVFCRIKPHTAFRGPYESGIMKMLAIGLGNQHGAEACHATGFGLMGENIELFGKEILNKAPILFSVAVIENAFDQTEKIYSVEAEKIVEIEPPLLKEAYSLMGRLYEPECDVLIVDKIGKNYSGDGMDPNITGTFSTPYADGGIKSKRVCVLDLSEETHGNGVGIGMADITTQRAVDKLDLDSMYANVITSTVLGGVKIPMIMESDKEAIQLAIHTLTDVDTNNLKIIKITDSLNVFEIMMSEYFYDKVQNNKNYTILSEPKELQFDEHGNF